MKDYKRKVPFNTYWCQWSLICKKFHCLLWLHVSIANLTNSYISNKSKNAFHAAVEQSVIMLLEDFLRSWHQNLFITAPLYRWNVYNTVNTLQIHLQQTIYHRIDMFLVSPHSLLVVSFRSNSIICCYLVNNQLTFSNKQNSCMGQTGLIWCNVMSSKHKKKVLGSSKQK